MVGRAIAQVGDEVGGHLVPGDLQQRAVQGAIEVGVLQPGIVRHGDFHRRHERLQVGALLIGGALGREPGHEAFQGAASLGDLDRVRQGDAAHRCTAVRFPAHQPLAVELEQRGPDRGPTDLVALGQLELDEALAGRERAGEDVVAQSVGCLLYTSDAADE